MKLYELCLDLYEQHDGKNIAVWYKVVTPEVGDKFGTTYEGNRIPFGGGGSRLSDVPAYLGGCEVVSWRVDPGRDPKAYIEI